MSVKELSFDSNADEVEAVEKVGESTETFSKLEKGVWVNEKETPIDTPIICLIPQKIVIIMRSIERLITQSGMGTLEFGIYVTGNLSEDGQLTVGEEFFLPSQKVGGASIDFNEEPPAPKFNGVIHRHPTGCKSFSGTDGKYINSNFEFSLLYESNDIIKGILNIKIKGFRLQVDLDPRVAYPIIDLSSEQITTKIKKMESPVSENSRWPNGKSDVRHLLRSGMDSQLGFDLDVEDDDDPEPEYQCKKCGEIQEIISFPAMCQSCEMMLSEDDVDEIFPEDIKDVPPVDPNDMTKIENRLEMARNSMCDG